MSTNQPPSPTWTAPPPGRYLIDPEHSSVAVRTKHFFGLGNVEATFALRKAEVLVAEHLEESRVEAVVDSTSFNSHNAGRDKRVRSKSLLDVVAYPDIRFDSVAVSKADCRWTAQGTLTARGHAAPLELAIVSVAEEPSGMTFVATGRVDRYAHGVSRAKGFAGRYLDVTITAVSQRRDLRP